MDKELLTKLSALSRKVWEAKAKRLGDDPLARIQAISELLELKDIFIELKPKSHTPGLLVKREAAKAVENVVSAFESVGVGHSGESVPYMPISDYIRWRLFAVGIDAKKILDHSLDFDSIRHIDRRHGPNGIVSRNVRHSDLLMLPYVVENANSSIVSGRTRRGLPAAKFEIRIRGRKYSVVTEVQNKKRLLALKTFWIDEE